MLSVALICPALVAAPLVTCVLEFPSASADHTVHFDVEVVRSRPDRERGLMGRTDLAPHAGMLFDFDTERAVTMWMKNTPLALDMVFITSGGRIAHIERNAVPFSESLMTSPVPVRYVLEVVAGGAESLRTGAVGAKAVRRQLHQCLAKWGHEAQK
jgi:uncharacterized protein